MNLLPELFQPLDMGRMRIANRIMMPGMSAGMMLDDKSHPNAAMIAYFVERAQARPGLMAIGAASVVPPTRPERHPLALWDEGVVAPLTRLVSAVHCYDTKFGIQLWDGGTQTGRHVQLSPSAVPAMAVAVGDKKIGAPILKALSVAEIHQVVGYFAAAAARCVKSGFDFVEIHAGHGYLISAFLNPTFNRRSDEYGGCFENRARFLLEILRAVRHAVGVKINGSVFFAGQRLDGDAGLQNRANVTG